MKKIFTIYILCSLLLLIGCEGKITKENYNKISTGMRKTDVEAILGKGQSVGSSSVDLGEFGGEVNAEVISWQNGKTVISVSFLNGKVQAKAENGLK
jgi:hypothetical protein